jgi:hypothetical protein
LNSASSPASASAVTSAARASAEGTDRDTPASGLRSG